jgi:tetratricopeptide (TPR) repeat protein
MPADPKAFETAHTRLAALYGDPAAARRRFESGLSKNPADPMAHYGLALVLSRENRYTEALSHIRAALAHNAFDRNLLAEMGKLYFLQGRYEDALGALSSIADASSPNPDGLFYLGRTQAALGQTDAAEATFLELAEHYPDYPQLDYFLGEIYQKKGRADLVHYYLGMHFYKSGNAASARFHLQRAKERLTDSRKKETVESALKDLGEAKG